MRRGASESIVFGLKSTKKSTKVVKKRWRICSGRKGREFESRRLDQFKRFYRTNNRKDATLRFLFKEHYDQQLTHRKKGRMRITL